MKIIYRLGAILLMALTVFAAAHAAGKSSPANYIFTSAGDFDSVRPLLARQNIGGVQVVFTWKSLEPEKGRYDFSTINRILAATDAMGKALFIQLQDRFFSIDDRNVPSYLQTDPVYAGGLVAQTDNAGESKKGHGWVAIQWNSALRQRYQALLAALAEKFDGRVAGINLPESSIDIDAGHDRTGFSCNAYFNAEMDNLAAARRLFTRSHVVQYVNFWPCEWENDHDFMGRLFEYAASNGIGLGGPDIVPWRKGQMKNSYPFFNRYKGKLPLVAMAVQEPTLTYRNPKTHKPFTRAEFTSFATDYLGADIIFWSPAAPWLRGH